MNINEILSLPPEKWLEELQVDSVEGRDIQSNIDYYSGKHPILTNETRQDYYNTIYEKDEETNKFKRNSQTGAKIVKGRKLVKRTKLILNYPVQIIDTAVGMCVGSPVTLILNSGDESGHTDAFNIFVDQWQNKTRLDTFNLTMSRALFKESKCAEVFFIDPEDEDKDIKVMLLSKENGDDIWAHFDDSKKMDAITRIFERKDLVEGKPKDVEVVQIWTAKERWEKIDNANYISVPNPYDKLEIIYYDQKYPEFEIVKELITKQEMVRSQNSDVNRRIGNPNIVINGELNGMPETEDDVKVWNTIPTQDGEGKLVQSSVNYLELKGAAESIKAEVDMDNKDMYRLSWNDLSRLMEDIKTGNLSGTAIKLMFVSAFVKIGNKREIYEDFSRRVSVMKRMLTKTRANSVFDELNISVVFNSVLPENIAEIAETLSTAVESEITSKEHSRNLFPLNAGNPNITEEVEEEKKKDISRGGISE